MREKFFLPATFVICAAMFIVWHQFFYTAIQREILSAELETRRLREVERELAELRTRHKSLATLAAIKESELDDARKFLPATLEQDKFIDELYRTADFCRVSLTAVTANEIISADDFQAQVLTVKLEANYISLLNFLREILDGGRLVSLEKFSVTGSKVLDCELTFKIFATAP